MDVLVLILKVLITIVFVGAAFQKFTGKVAPSWERWGFPRQVMYATGVAELIGVVLLWLPGFELIGAAVLALVLLGALATLVKNHEGASHIALPAVTLLLVFIQTFLTTRG